jgi:pyruvate/2-oxoglutarate dehydrogenase complex dihydrolipoamide dehydrogenase (E3) component
MSMHYGVIIIGGGNTGFGVSALALEAGKRIAFIEEVDFGGTCAQTEGVRRRRSWSPPRMPCMRSKPPAPAG